MSFVVYYVYKRTQNDYTVIATCLAYSVVIGTTVGWMLSYLYGLPLLLTIAYVAIGNIIATCLLDGQSLKYLRKQAYSKDGWETMKNDHILPKKAE